MTTRTAREYNENRKEYRGAILRKTRNAGNVWYQVLKETNEHHLKRLEKKQRFGRDEHLYIQLSQGWLPFRRYRRYTETNGTKRTTTEIVAVPPDYKFREVQKKPGWA